jgi:predicted nucleic acid-binding protein
VGALSLALPSAVYFDANIVIHIVEGHPKFRAAIDRLLEYIETGRIAATTSELTLAEVLVRPLRDGDQERVCAFEALLTDTPQFRVIAIDRRIMRRSAELRAALGGSLPDAIHAASTEAFGCNVFLSEDSRIRLPSTLTASNLIDFASLSSWPVPKE